MPNAFDGSYDGAGLQHGSYLPMPDANLAPSLDFPPQYDPVAVANALQAMQHFTQMQGFPVPNADFIGSTFDGQPVAEELHVDVDEDAHYLERDGMLTGTQET